VNTHESTRRRGTNRPIRASSEHGKSSRVFDIGRHIGFGFWIIFASPAGSSGVWLAGSLPPVIVGLLSLANEIYNSG
jgi:hypothetical protein